MNKQLMAHTVLGYPARPDSIAFIRCLDELRVPYIEVQLPFSDPVADGPVLTHANASAAAHMTQSAGFADLQVAMQGMTYSKVVLMCYAQTIFSYGLQRFCQEASRLGIVGLIVPDLPYDQPEYTTLKHHADKYKLTLIPVFSPNMSFERVQPYAPAKAPFIYVTARLGVTGAHTGRGDLHDVNTFLAMLKRRYPTCRIALGFGIHTAADVRALPTLVDIAVVGSAITQAINQDGTAGGVALARALLAACDTAIPDKKNE